MPPTPNPQSGFDGTIVHGDEIARVISRFFFGTPQACSDAQHAPVSAHYPQKVTQGPTVFLTGMSADYRADIIAFLAANPCVAAPLKVK